MRLTISPEEFRTTWSSLLDAVPRDAFLESRFVHVPANRAPWMSTGIQLAAGERVSIFSIGSAWIASNPSASQGAHFALWFRIGGRAPTFRASRCARTFTVSNAGELELANIFPTTWADDAGAIAAPGKLFERVAGGFEVLVIRWPADAESGLEQLARGRGIAAESAAKELEILRNPVRHPAGWKYLSVIGQSDTFTEAEDGAIRCDVDDDAAILQKPVSAPFEPGTRLRWSWKVDCLPAAAAEDSIANHDYLSIAVEFDNGQDLTYFWSAALPPEKSFHCPLSLWRERETHLVVRAGRDELGRWMREDRDLWLDYTKAVGMPPARIVAVWLIAVSNFGHRRGQCEYRDLELITGTGTRVVV